MDKNGDGKSRTNEVYYVFGRKSSSGKSSMLTGTRLWNSSDLSSDNRLRIDLVFMSQDGDFSEFFL